MHLLKNDLLIFISISLITRVYRGVISNQVVPELDRVGFDALSLANNQEINRGPEGFELSCIQANNRVTGYQPCHRNETGRAAPFAALGPMLLSETRWRLWVSSET